jgi:hypothetical protein
MYLCHPRCSTALLLSIMDDELALDQGVIVESVPTLRVHMREKLLH